MCVGCFFIADVCSLMYFVRLCLEGVCILLFLTFARRGCLYFDVFWFLVFLGFLFSMRGAMCFTVFLDGCHFLIFYV